MSSDIKKVKDWYDHEYAHNPHRFIRKWQSYNRFIDPIEPERGKRLLDVACGTAGLLKAAEEKGLIPFGLDISIEGIALAVRYSGCRQLVVAAGEHLPYRDETFDYVTNIGSLEHFQDPHAGLAEMVRVLKQKGKICVVLPNSFGRFGKLIGYAGTGQILERIATLREWKSFLENGQLKVISVHRDLGPSILHDIKVNKILLRLAAKLLLPLLPTSCSYQFIFICQKGNHVRHRGHT